MLTKFNDSNDMNTIASDAIHSYLKDGYRIDANESVIDRKDKDCAFKAVLKKDTDGIECKTVITLTDNGDEKNKSCTYHKVETVGDTKWSEETRTFSSSTDKTKLNSAVKNHILDNICRTPRMWWSHADDDFIDYYHDTVRNIFKDFGLHCDWFGDEFSDRQKRLADKKASADNKLNADKKDTKWECKCPSAYQKLDDYIKLNTDDRGDDGVKIKFTAPDGKEVEVVDLHDKEVKAEPAKDSHIEGDGTAHVKLNRDESVDDVYKEITDKQKDGLKEACDAKARKDWLASKDDPDEEDDLLKLVRLIFGR